MQDTEEEELYTEVFSEFLSAYPAYKETMVIDSLRKEEYGHLEESDEEEEEAEGSDRKAKKKKVKKKKRKKNFKQVCLDYTGVGLFSNSQRRKTRESSSRDHSSHASATTSTPGFGLSYISLNLATHAMYPEDGSLDSAFRKRILRYLNLDEEDFFLVFTANSFSAFKLLGESYPFHESPNLLLAYDHRSDDTQALGECVASRSGSTRSVNLSLPHLKIDTDDLYKKLGIPGFSSLGATALRKVGQSTLHHGNNPQPTSWAHGHTSCSKGLFAFPYCSRVTGCRNSSRWIQDAQTNGWHVLLDVTSMDAKMLGSLGLSLFLPDFVICSFYHVFGHDPTGMGCLAIKKTVLRTLGDSSRARAIGMVKIVKKEGQGYDCFESPRDEHQKEDIERSNGESVNWRSNSDPLNGMAFDLPELSADIVEIDKSLFYRSDSESMDVGLSNVKGDEEVSQTNKNKYMSAPHMQVKSQNAPSKSTIGWMPWDLSSEYRNYETFYQAKSRRRQNVEINEEVDTISSDEIRSKKKWGAHENASSRRTVKDLFYLDEDSARRDIKFSSEYALMLSRKKNPSTGHVGTESGNKTERSVENDWRAFNARKARSRISASSSSMSSVSVPTKMDRNTDIEICCKGLDQADILGYKRIAIRLRSLASWLISSLSTLQHPGQDNQKLVKVYSQVSPLHRGSTIALSLYDSAGNALDPHRVQLLADRNNISLRVGVIEGTLSNDNLGNHNKTNEKFLCIDLPGYKWRSRGDSLQSIQVPVVYASLGFLNNFSDVYKLWSFVSKLLDPDFVNKELWHYQALNQETIEI